MALFVAVLLALTLFLLGYRYLTWPSAFNSDDLLCSNIVEDVFRGEDIHEWHLPGAPYLFPDLFLLAPCRWLAPNLVVEFLAYHFLFWGLMVAVLWWLGELLRLSRRSAFVAAAVGVAFLAAVHLGPAYGRAPKLVHPGNHVGAVLVGLFLLAMTVQAVRHGYGIASAIVCIVLGGLGAFSDRLVLLQFLTPTALALGLLWLRRRINMRQLAVHAAVFAGIVGLSMLLRALFVQMGIHFLRVEDWFGRPTWADLETMAHLLKATLDGQVLLKLLIPLYLVLCVLVGSLAVATGGPPVGRSSTGGLPVATELFGWALFLSPVCNLVVLFLLGQGRNSAIDRYLLPCWLLPLLCPALLAALLPWQRPRALASTLVPAAMAVFVACRVAAGMPAVEAARLEVPYPPLAQALDRLVHERGALRGLAGFWEARSLSFLTRERVPVRPLNFVGEPWFHACNPASFLATGAEGTPTYQFILAVDRPAEVAPPREVLLAHYGPPKEKLIVGRDEIWLYDRVRSSALDRFLSAALAERLAAERPFVGPDEPACLSRPKANRTQPRRGTAAAPQGQSLELHFAAPVRGVLLDVAADHAADCLLEFFHSTATRPLAVVRVPPVPWTGAAYDAPGLQSRLVPLPPILQHQHWDRIVVRPRSSHGVTLGHVLLFQHDFAAVTAAHTEAPERLRLEAEALLPVAHDLGHPRMRELVTKVADDHASGGAVRRAVPPWQLAIAETPSLTLSPGRYRVDFALRAEGDPLEAAALLCVEAPAPAAIRQQRALRVADLAGKGYRTESLIFEIAEEVDDVHIGVRATGKAVVLVDYLELQRLGPAGPEG
jgi:hypothetical protein